MKKNNKKKETFIVVTIFAERSTVVHRNLRRFVSFPFVSNETYRSSNGEKFFAARYFILVESVETFFRDPISHRSPR